MSFQRAFVLSLIHIWGEREITPRGNLLRSGKTGTQQMLSLIHISLFTGITFTRAAALFGLTELPLWYFGFLLIVALLYMLLTTMVKVFYQKKYRELI